MWFYLFILQWIGFFYISCFDFPVAYIGLCVSGQKISDLLNRIKGNFYPTSEKTILMIGTNDLLQVTLL